MNKAQRKLKARLKERKQAVEAKRTASIEDKQKPQSLLPGGHTQTEQVHTLSVPEQTDPHLTIDQNNKALKAEPPDQASTETIKSKDSQEQGKQLSQDVQAHETLHIISKQTPKRKRKKKKAVSQSTKQDLATNSKSENGKPVQESYSLAPSPTLAPSKFAKKLTAQARKSAISMLALGYTSRAVRFMLIQNYDISLARRTIDQMRTLHLARITDVRQILAKDILTAVPMASKLERLAVRDEMVQYLRRRPHRKNSQTDINKILDSIKAEVEPFEVAVNISLTQKTAAQFKALDDNSVIAEAMAKLKEAGMEVAQVVSPDSVPESAKASPTG